MGLVKDTALYGGMAAGGYGGWRAASMISGTINRFRSVRPVYGAGVGVIVGYAGVYSVARKIDAWWIGEG